MTIESKLSKNVYIGNGSTVIFPFTFKIWEENQISVTVEDPDGFTDTATPEKITLSENGGEIMLYFDSEQKLPYPAGYKIAITRNMPFLQESDYINGSRINTEVIEKDLDIAAAERQQLLEQLSRSLIMAATDERSPEEVLQDFLAKYLDISAKYPEIITAFNTIYPRIEEVLLECAANEKQARAWAESDTPPDSEVPDSKSAKTWAAIAADTVPLASKTIAGKVQIGSNIDVTSQGVISVKDGTTAQKGAVQLTSTVDNDETKAVTPKALNEIKKTVDSFFAGGIFKTGDFKISFKNALDGFLLCDGSAVSRKTYAELFAVIGTKFGAGDGSSTFNLPDLRGRFIQGANGDLGSYKQAGLPNITGQFGRVNQLHGSNASGCFTLIPISSGGGYTLLTATSDFSFSAQKSNPIYGASTTVQPPAVALNIFIKY